MPHSIQSVRLSAWIGRRTIIAVMIVMLTAFALAIGLLYRIAVTQDERLAVRSVRIAQAALAARRDTLQKTLMDYAGWGGAYEHLHTRLDIGWAFLQGNLGPTLYPSYGIDYLAVFSPVGECRYFVVRGDLADCASIAKLGPGIGPIIAAAGRAGEGDKTVVLGGTATIEGMPVLIGTAALSTNDDKTVARIPGPPSVLLFGDRLDPSKLDILGSKLFLAGLRSAPPGDAAGEPHLVLPLLGGGTATLRWLPEEPGRELLAKVLPGVLAAGMTLCIFVVVVVVHAQRAAAQIRESAARLSAAHAEAERRALHDTVTGLPNRAKLTRALARDLAAGRSVAVLYMDLDRFKPVNDAFGHPVGDDVLCTVAERLERVIGAGGVAARVGGDEFAAVLRETDREGVERTARRILSEIAAPIDHRVGRIFIGISIGIALAPTDASDGDELLRLADVALYEAKRAGRGTLRFVSADMDGQILHRQALEAELHAAVEAEEFVLHFQPRFETNGLRVRSVEALLRWNHPARGLIPPADFIPLAEETGLIVPLGAWVLRSACLAVRPWPELHVSVNVSAVQFRSADLAETVRAVLAETGLEPHRLELEITESVLIEDGARAGLVLADLKALGLRLAMDDFGTGYSSLGTLQAYPFDAIKIDRSFVSRLGGTGSARAIVNAILGLGRALDLTVTAEGVETAEQLLLLRSDRCHEVQGFYMARPAPLSDLEALLGPTAAGEAAERRSA